MTDKQLADEDLWSDEICAVVDAAFETVSRNPNDHEEAVAYRRAIAAALRQPTPDAMRKAIIEECAKVAEEYPTSLTDMPMVIAMRGVAKAIRNLQDPT